VRFLKGFGTFVLGLLLFISISVFGLAFVLHGTLLSPGFVKKQVDRIDISGVARDLADQQIQNYLPPELSFLQAAVYSAIDAQEPWIIAQADSAIDSSYAFLLSKTNVFTIQIPLDTLKTNLKNSLWLEMNKQLTSWLRSNALTQLEPYIFQNLSLYRPLFPPELAALTDAQLKTYIDTFLKQTQTAIITTGSAPLLTGLLTTLVQPYFNYYYDQYAAQIPDALTADSTTIPLATMNNLFLVRKYVGEFQAAYYWLIVLIILLAAGIFLIYRNIQEPSRALGIDLAVFGALDLAGVLVARAFNPADSLLSLLPQKVPSLEPWLNALYRDVTGKMLAFSIGVLVVGAIFIGVSFIFRKNEAEV
jgi:hypothetical protein